MKNTMTTLSQVMEDLRKRGYTEDFNLREDCIYCVGATIALSPDEFRIDRYYRFEGASDPADEAIVYAISSDVHNMKGILVNGYGTTSDPLTDKMLEKLRTN
jgi:hypothetical protein